MLQTIDDDGNLSWHCVNPTCEHHHCSGSHAIQQCMHHPDSDVSGTPHTAHVSHAEIDYVRLPSHTDEEGNTHHAPVDGSTVALPLCTCGTQMFVRTIFAEEECQMPEVRAVYEPGIGKQVIRNLASDVSIPRGCLHLVKYHAERYLHERPDGTTAEVYFVIFDGIEVHPAIALHQKLRDHLHRIGKHHERIVVEKTGEEKAHEAPAEQA